MPEVTAENNGDKFKMKKKTIVISAIAGIFVMVLCVKLAINGRGEPVVENTVANENAVSDGTNGQLGQEKTKTETPLEAKPEAEKPKEMELEEVQTDLAPLATAGQPRHHAFNSHLLHFLNLSYSR